MKKLECFEDVVQAMTAKEIIMAMVEGLRKPAVNIDFNTFGSREKDPLNKYKHICYGCAATNTICYITGKPYGAKSIIDVRTRGNFINSNHLFLFEFEKAINCLRMGDLAGYNFIADFLDIAHIQETGFALTFLQNGFELSDLDSYVELAEMQPKSNRANAKKQK